MNRGRSVSQDRPRSCVHVYRDQVGLSGPPRRPAPAARPAIGPARAARPGRRRRPLPGRRLRRRLPAPAATSTSRLARAAHAGRRRRPPRDTARWLLPPSPVRSAATVVWKGEPSVRASASPEQVMHHPTGAWYDVAVEPVEQLLRRGPQPRATTQRDGRDDDVQGVDEVGVQELPDGVRAAT